MDDVSEGADNAPSEIAVGDIAAAISETVEAAENRADHAEEVTALIVDAAIEGERADRVSALERGLEKCLNQMETMGATMADLGQTLITLTQICRANEDGQEKIQLELIALQQALIQPTLTETPAETPSEAIIPEIIEDQPVIEPKVKEAPKKRHLFL